MDPRGIEEAVERMQALAPVNAEEPLVPPEWRDEEDESVSGPWQIDSRSSLDWAMSRLAKLRAEAEAIETQAAAAIDRIEKRKASLLERIQRGAGFFEYKIAEYAHRERQLLLGGGKRKSADLLHGRIGWRSKGGKLTVDDKPTLLAWLERQPPEGGLYRVKLEPEMKAIQDNFKTTGEIPPGCSYQQPEETFYVEPTAPELETHNG